MPRNALLSLWLAFLFTWHGIAPSYAAAPPFPELTGRVVDNAHILTEATQHSLEQSLAEYENGTGNQVVVATLPSLEGYSIEEYGYRLGRHWQIGQKGKDNGVILLVAPNEHKVRIEVGYGLEPVLTDAACSQIIHQIILPDFRDKQMEKGVMDGTQAILSVLGGKGVPLRQQQNMDSWEAWLILLVFLWFFLFSIFHPRAALFIALNTPSRFGGSGLSQSGWGGGGFSGGGGSFGGGGASGRW